MKNVLSSFKDNPVTLALASLLLVAGSASMAADSPAKGTRYIYQGSGNPYLPLWEHLPDGEPRVFEDPDNPGKYRVYIIGSHDVRATS